MTDERICKHINKPVGKCQLNNVQCAYPACVVAPLTNEPVGVMTKTEFELFDACWNLLEKLRGGGNLMNSDTLKEREYKAQAVLLSRLDARNTYALLHEDESDRHNGGEL